MIIVPYHHYYAFFIDRKDAELSIWKEPFHGPYEYERIDTHGNEWIDLLYDRYELWICDLALGKRRIKKPEIVLEEIKNDFLSDCMEAELKYKYHGKWLVVQVVSIDDDELPTLSNPVISNERTK